MQLACATSQAHKSQKVDTRISVCNFSCSSLALSCLGASSTEG